MIETYLCDCGSTLKRKQPSQSYICDRCRCEIPSDEGILRFTSKPTDQTDHFDAIYGSGYNNVEQQSRESKRDEYLAHAPTALNYLKFAGYDIQQPITNLSILDAACGAGWTAAAFYMHESIKDCDIHAFDIAPEGVRRLKGYLANTTSSNRISYSIQDALSMHFLDEEFDLIVGSSILHHFDDYESYLKGCLRILKPGGKAVFGEPFAVGYGLLYTAMKVALDDLQREYAQIEALINDVSVRISQHGNPGFLENLVDKHLFFYSEIIECSTRVGFEHCEIKPLHTLEHLGSGIVDEMYNEIGIDDPTLRERTKTIYGVIYEIFASKSTYGRSLSPFNYVVFSK